MGQLIPIVVPTHGRAGKVKALRVFPGAVLCVADSQRDAYASAYPDAELVTHPDSVKGLSPKRQWIYERWGDVFMVDDDVADFRRVTVQVGESPYLRPPVPELVVQATAETARQLGVYLFGFSQIGDPAMYRPFAPLSLTGFVGGHAMGVLSGSKLYWHPDSATVDDFWISLLNAHHHRMALIDRRYFASQEKTFAGVGGQGGVRTEDTYRTAYLFLKAHFGESVQMKRDYMVRGKGKGKRQLRRTPAYRPSASIPF